MADICGVVVVYSHEHGVDVITENTVEDAHNRVYGIMAEWANELVEEGNMSVQKVMELVKLIKDKDMESALTLWNDETSEWFEIRKVTFDLNKNKHGDYLDKRLDSLQATINEMNS